MSRFALPDLGEGLHEAEIVAWHVGPGDHVVADQPLVSVETDKAIVEVPAPRAGRIARLVGVPGEVIAVGDTLVEFADGEPEDAGTVLGRIAPSAPLGPEPPAPELPVLGPPAAAAAAPRPLASPAVRRRARELGVDIARVRPGGGRSAPSLADAEAHAAAGGVPGGDGWEPLRGPRRAMARRMERTRAEVTPATVTDDADVDDWPAADRVLPRLVRALTVACAVEPSVNAWYDAARGARMLHARVDLGIAVDTADGLFVPVLRDAAEARNGALEARLAALRAAAEARALAPSDLLGATLTLSNFGPLGGRHAALCVAPPQVAILGAGRCAPTVRVRDGAPAVRRVLPLSLSFDHRVVTGGEAARFLAAVVADLERP